LIVAAGVLVLAGLFVTLRSTRRRRRGPGDQEARQAFFRSVSKKDHGENGGD
jgi:hypothetical protein